jgi:hypothetical protein
MIHRRPMSMLPLFDSKRARGWTTVSDCIVMECVPCRIALSDMVSEDEKFTGGLGPLRSMAGRIECLLEDIERIGRGSDLECPRRQCFGNRYSECILVVKPGL